jgi:hypothetical protein
MYYFLFKNTFVTFSNNFFFQIKATVPSNVFTIIGSRISGIGQPLASLISPIILPSV